ncbi:adenine phosphoribosyltransferase [Rubritalea profundi]|uniref:Adenine phosphoribosyltransferase n=1 Tax=Rubritalea profundi TaxID=1658618 RepID=A0A2S7TXN2_9BACT|nr:adenine phosphoribosyltransferase [Rubritalea profundi]PQJ27516.1 adenine phosphoribosyltransferase [Rubritalea profundi]
MPDKLRAAIRDVPNFPKEGIIFKDITPVLGDPELLQLSIDQMAATADGLEIDKVVGIDARGFIFAPPIALKYKAGFVPVRKKGKLPWNTKSIRYSLEYGENEIEIHEDAVKPGDKVLLIDDLLATGGTAAAAVKLLKQLGAEVVCVTFLIELDFLNGREAIDCENIHSILHYS